VHIPEQSRRAGELRAFGGDLSMGVHFGKCGKQTACVRAVFARVRYCDRSLHLANLFLLLTSALIPFPTTILSTAIQSGNEFDAKAAVTLYAAIAGTMCLSWLVVFHVLSLHPHLVEDGVSPDFFPKERFPRLARSRLAIEFVVVLNLLEKFDIS
jgi:uncharacterized membrane protein